MRVTPLNCAHCIRLVKSCLPNSKAQALVGASLFSPTSSLKFTKSFRVILRSARLEKSSHKNFMSSSVIVNSESTIES